MLPHPVAPVTELTLDQLARPALEQVRRYVQRLCLDDSRHALEIVRRAASRDPAAFATLLGLCDPLVEQGCPPGLWTRQDELERETGRRLEHRFFHNPSPYAVSTLPAFVRYVRMTVRCGVVTLLQRRVQTLPLDTAWGWEPSTPSQAETSLDDEARFQTAWALLASLDNPLQREALLRRHAYGQSVAAIETALRSWQPDVTTQQVYRLLDQGKRRLQRVAAHNMFLGRLAA